jgi:hypothetical protein
LHCHGTDFVLKESAMTKVHRSTHSSAPAPTESRAHGHEIPSTSKGGPAPDQAPTTGTEEAALIYAEIDRVLAKAMVMARYFGKDAVENALALASRINRMEFDGRKA